MLFDYETLKFIWWLLIGVLFIGFAIMDGMDMGVGIVLRALGKTDNERRAIINTVGPHWDGNQVWFITAGGALFAAWPPVYGAAFSGFYFAMMLVLFALFLRPMAFDYRSKIEDLRWRNSWDWALLVGSAVPVIVFGVAAGNLLQGVPFSFDQFMRVWYSGSFWALLNPFALLVGLVALSMLVMHGAIWIQLRTERVIANRARKLAISSAAIFIVLFAGAGIWVAQDINGYKIVSELAHSANPQPLQKEVAVSTGAWVENYQLYPITKLAPIAAFAGALLALLLAFFRVAGTAFLCSSISIAGTIFTFGVSMFPFIMPSSSNPRSSLTLWDATSSHLTLNVMFIAAAVFVPIIIAYTAWNYYKMWRVVTVSEIENNPHSTY